MKKRIISLLLALVTGISFLGTCGCKEQENSSSVSQTQEEGVKKYTFNGTHILTAPEREDYLVQNGQTQYKLVVPKNADFYTSMALSEFVNFFQQATGIAMPYIIEDDAGLTHSATGKYISLGNTKMYQSSGLSFDESVIKKEGVRIVTKDNTVYINGGTNGGVLYGVYDILQILFNYEVFHTDCWYIDENVKNLKMRKFDVTDVPDIPNRQSFTYYVTKNTNNIAYRFRTPKESCFDIMPLGDTENGEIEEKIHNTNHIISKNYEGYESQWSGEGTGQLCLTAHGDVESYNRMVDRAVEVITKELIKYNPTDYPQYRVGSFTPMDGAPNCSCLTCAKLKEKYGAHSAGLILFCNAVMGKIRPWMEQPENAAYRRDDFMLMFFAYNSYVDAPVRYDEVQDKYVMSSPDLELRDDVGLFYATSPCVQFSSNIYDEVNEVYRTRCEQWFDVAKNVYIWMYHTVFQAYLGYTGHEVFNKDYYQFMARGDIYGWCNQGAYNSYASSFQDMKAYLDAKFTWDSNSDQTELVNRYFENMYGPASNTMKEIMMQMQSYRYALLQKLNIYNDITASNHLELDRRQYWPLQLVRGWVALFDKAYAEIEDYKDSDPATYQQLKTRIDREYIGTAFYYLKAYQENTIDTILYEKVRSYFKTELAKFALDKYQPGEGIKRYGTLADFLRTL